MFCEKCGAQLHSDTRFCRFCGASTELVAAPAQLRYIPPPPLKAKLQQKQIGMTVLLGVAMLAAMFLPGMIASILIHTESTSPFWLLRLFRISMLVAAVTLCAVTKKWKALWPTIVFAIVPLIDPTIRGMLIILLGDLIDNIGFHTFFGLAVALLQLACIVITIVLLVRDFKRNNELNMLEVNHNVL